MNDLEINIENFIEELKEKGIKIFESKNKSECKNDKMCFITESGKYVSIKGGIINE